MDFSPSLDSDGLHGGEVDMMKSYKNISNSDQCNLIINYVPQDIDDNALRGMFAEFGEIIQAKIVRDKTSKKSLGYGFVKYLDQDGAIEAINAMNGFPLGHKKLKVSYARVSSEEIKNCKLYVTNLPRSFNSYDVTNLFRQFGEIIECRLLKDRQTGVNKGVAFVQFNIRAEADRAMSLDGQYLEGADKPIIIKYAEDQHKKRDRRLMPLVPVRFRQDSPLLYSMDQLSQGAMMGGPKSMGYGNLGNGQAYLPVAVAMPYGGYQIKYTNSVPSSPASSWYGQMQHPVYDGAVGGMGGGMSRNVLSSSSRHGHGQTAYEHLDMNSFNQQRAASTVFMTNPRGGQEGGYGSPVTVVVNRLPPSVDVALIEDLFSPYGSIMTAQVGTEEYTSSGDPLRSRAYVEMENLAQAQNAVQALNGSNPFQREGLGPLQVNIRFKSLS